jgi:hypothetical protein
MPQLVVAGLAMGVPEPSSSGAASADTALRRILARKLLNLGGHAV